MPSLAWTPFSSNFQALRGIVGAGLEAGVLSLGWDMGSGAPSGPSVERRQPRGAVSTVIEVAMILFRGTCRLFIYLTIVVRYLVGKALVLAFLGFLLLAVLQAPHPQKWETWTWLILLRKLANPLLTGMDATLEWPEAKPFYPMALAVAASFAMFSVDTRLWQLEGWLRKAATSGIRKPAYRVPLGPSAPPLAAPRDFHTPASLGSSPHLPR